MDFPIYEAIIGNDTDGVFAISIVDDPATMSNFQFFAKENEIQRFAVQSEEEQLITGVVMLADTPIYRVTKGGYKYYVVYHKDTLKCIAEKMLREGLQNQVDFQHNGQYVDGIHMVELYIKDEAKGIVPNFLSDVPDGSLIATYHVDDKQMFESIKESGFQGFSLAGRFTLKEEFSNQEIIKEEKHNRVKMKLAKIIKKMFMSYSSVSTDKGMISYAGEEDIKVGDEVYVEDAEGNQAKVEDGEYVLEDGGILVVADSKVAEIKETAETEKSEDDETIEEIDAPEFEDPKEEEEKPAEEEEKTEEEEKPVEEEEKPAEEEEVVEEPTEEPAAEDDTKAEIEALKAEIAALKEALAALQMKPAADPIEKEFEKCKEKETKRVPNLYR